MNKLTTLFLIFISFTYYGQSKSVLNINGKTLEEIIPNDWKVLDSKTRDLNQDGILDLVFAIQGTDNNKLELNNRLELDTVDLNPRIMGIYFGTKSGIFTQKLVSEEFIILRDSPTMDEPFDGFNISEKGVLDINFRFWFSAGSWTMSNYKYRFRFQDNDLVLIGYDSDETHRGTGATTGHSINFLAKKMKITKGNFSNDDAESIEWKKFNLKNPITIKMIDKPFQLGFEGIYL